ncbi:LacI family DNA-binding transcriptional regulator, partial [Tateyamaria sp. syn59]|uniref:LacI family DNA-binding transcriptional regulator n=1 Tax=Tateyamaria sp. syn59 TaxID=2576942 RepID=UPI00167AA28C
MISEQAKQDNTARQGKAPNSEDVARIAGVSRSTVSRVFTPGAKVAEATRERVISAAQEVGYGREPLPAIQGKTGSTYIGLVMGSLDNPFYHTVLTEFMERFQRRNIHSICHAARDLETAETSIRSMLDAGVDAIIAACLGTTSTAIEACRAANVPLILFNRSTEDRGVSSIQTDNVEGGRTVADFLVRGRHQRIAYVNGIEDSSTNRDRLQGLRDRLRELSAPPPIQEYGEYTYNGGREAAKRLMILAEPPDAIFCGNDIMALGVLDCLRNDLGKRVPEDVSVVGFDDIPMA